MIFREKLVNASTGEVRQGNVLDSSLGEVEQIMIDSSLCSVMFYWAKTPDNTWRKTQYYELVENLFSITYKVNDSIYQTYYLQEGDDVPVPDYTPATGYTWSGWLNENIPDKMPASDIVVESYTEQTDYAIIYYIDGRVVYSETHHYNDSITAYVPETREHYVFSGWSGFPQSGYMPAENVTVTGTYEEDQSYVLSYYIDSSVYTQQSYIVNDAVIAPDDPQVENGYTWSGWVDLPSLMPAYDSSVHSVLTANQYILDYYVDSSLWNSLTYNYKQTIVSQTYTPAEGYLFSGWVNEPETMPAINHYRVDGMTSIITYRVTWYIDSSVLDSAVYIPGDTVTSPVSNNPDYIYEWPENYDTFTMPSEDVTIQGTRIDSSIMVPDIEVEDMTGVQFGIALTQYNTNSDTVTVDWDLYGASGEYNTNNATFPVEIQTYKFVEHNSLKTPGPYGIYGYREFVETPGKVYASVSLQYSIDGSIWEKVPSTRQIPFDLSNIDINEADDNGIVHIIDTSTCHTYIRLAISSINQVINREDVIGCDYFSMRAVNDEFYDEEDTDMGFTGKHHGYTQRILGKLIYPTIGGNMTHCQLFGEFDSFYSHLVNQFNSFFGTNINVRGIRLCVLYNAAFTHNVIERTQFNYIRSGCIGFINNNEYCNWDSSTLRAGIITTPKLELTQADNILGTYYDSHYSYQTCYYVRSIGDFGTAVGPLDYIHDKHRQLLNIDHSTNSYPTEFEEYSIKWENNSGVFLCDDVYAHRWHNCTRLKTTQNISDILMGVGNGSCESMYEGCTSLVTAPIIRCKRFIGSYAFYRTFYGCTSLVNAPSISAYRMGSYCFMRMFYNCTKLEKRATITINNTGNHPQNMYDDMYTGCTSLQD